jgi:hypothetical protein
MNWENPPPGFQYILFERIEPATASSDVARYYYLAFVPISSMIVGGQFPTNKWSSEGVGCT